MLMHMKFQTKFAISAIQRFLLFNFAEVTTAYETTKRFASEQLFFSFGLDFK